MVSLCSTAAVAPVCSRIPERTLRATASLTGKRALASGPAPPTLEVLQGFQPQAPGISYSQASAHCPTGCLVLVLPPLPSKTTAPPDRLPVCPPQTRITVQPKAIHVLVDEGRVPHEDVQLAGHGDARTRALPQRPSRSEHCPGPARRRRATSGSTDIRLPAPGARKGPLPGQSESGARAAKKEAEAVKVG